MAMNGLSKMAATALLLVFAIVPATIAETYTVGGASQWDSGVDYTEWVKGKTFRVGDILEFKYGASHSLDVVDKAGYDSCDGSSASENHSDGNTKIELKKTGPMYFLCPTPGHCQGGMKLAVTVVAAPSGSPATPSPGTPDSPPASGGPATPDSPPASGGSTTPTPAGSTPPPPPPAGVASKGMMSYVLVGVSMVLGYGLWM